MGKPREGVADSLGIGGPDVSAVASIGFEGWANVPPVKAVGCPGFAIGGFFVDQDSNAGGGYGGTVEVEVSMDLCPCG